MSQQGRPCVIVVGGGLAGLMTTIKAAELGMCVQLFSLVPVKRSHSVCAQGGINGAVNTKGEGDSPWIHTDDTIYGGDFLANQPPVQAMCEAAPGLINLLDRMGVTFNRTPEGLLDFRRFGGTQHHRTAYAGATTGQQLLYALDEQTRRHEVEGLVQKFEHWEYLGLVRDSEGACCGIVAQSVHTMEVKAFPADAVALATGGPGLLFGRSTNSVINTGAAAARAYQQGAAYGNGEFIQIHPTTIPGADKLRLISESVRGEGGRMWVPTDPTDTRDGSRIPASERWHFLEEWYPAYGNLVPRDIASRAIHKVCFEMGRGIGGQNEVFLDVTHKDPDELTVKLGGVLEIYEKFVGIDPRTEPMRVFPGVHYSMGGLWVDFHDQTSVPALFAVGEVNYQYHGANRLGANSLLSCLYDGVVAAPRMVETARARRQLAAELPTGLFSDAAKVHEERFEQLVGMGGDENPYSLFDEMGDLMSRHATVERHNDKLEQAEIDLLKLTERWQRVGIADKGHWVNQTAIFARVLQDMLVLARAVLRGALARNESRGAHFKPAHPERDDEQWLKTTKAEYTPDGPQLSYEPVDISVIPPRARSYETASHRATSPATDGGAAGEEGAENRV